MTSEYLVRLHLVPKYGAGVAEIQEYLVSSSGQMSSPAAARRRWHLDKGGPVDVIDLGFAVMTLPKGSCGICLARMSAPTWLTYSTNTSRPRPIFTSIGSAKVPCRPEEVP
jgi:hypothetical protein